MHQIKSENYLWLYTMYNFFWAIPNFIFHLYIIVFLNCSSKIRASYLPYMWYVCVPFRRHLTFIEKFDICSVQKNLRSLKTKNCKIQFSGRFAIKGSIPISNISVLLKQFPNKKIEFWDLWSWVFFLIESHSCENVIFFLDH